MVNENCEEAKYKKNFLIIAYHRVLLAVYEPYYREHARLAINFENITQNTPKIAQFLNQFQDGKLILFDYEVAF